MNDDIESRLHAALRPETPARGFTERVMQRIERAEAERSHPRPPARRRRIGLWSTASVAAAVLAAVGVREHLAQERERELGIAARRQVLEALQVTDRTLELAQRTFKDQTPGA